MASGRSSRRQSDELALARLRSDNEARVAKYRMLTYLGCAACVVAIVALSIPIAYAFAGHQTGISVIAGASGGAGLSLLSGGSVTWAIKKGRRAKDAETRTVHLSVQLKEANKRVGQLERDLAGVRRDLERRRTRD